MDDAQALVASVGLRNQSVPDYVQTIERMAPEGKYELFVHKQDDALQSRHDYSKTYILWIPYDCEK